MILSILTLYNIHVIVLAIINEQFRAVYHIHVIPLRGFRGYVEVLPKDHSLATYQNFRLVVLRDAPR